MNKERWLNANVSRGHKRNYQYLDSIVSYCSERKIEMYFIQSPIRKGLLKNIDNAILNDHIQMTKNIIEKHQQHYFNSTDYLWDDSLFVDGTHFNELGAKKYTKYCLGKLLKKQK